MTNCEACKGTGKYLISIHAGYMPCPECRGRGERSRIKEEHEQFDRCQQILEFEIAAVKKRSMVSWIR